MLASSRNSRGIVSFFLLPGVLSGLCATSPTALAQDKDSKLEEIVVTARYREERLQDTPIAISAITAADIEVRGLDEGYEITYVVPNASLRPAQAAFGNTMSAFIRGIGQYDFLPEFEPGVAIYFDDVLHPVTMGSMVDLMDLERVEVLRGPQGTLFGRGALGGAIRYVSKQPQGDGTGDIRVTVGSYNRIDLRGSYDFSLTDNLFARITGVSKSRDGHQDVFDYACLNPGTNLPQQIFNREAGCKIGTQGGEDVQGGRAILRWAANEDADLTFTADFLDDNSEARADTLVAIATNAGGPFDGQLPVPFNFWSAGQEATYGVPFDERFIPPDIYTSYATYSDPDSGIRFDPVTAIEQWGVSGKLDWNVADKVRTEVILSYREFDSAFATDTDQSPLGVETVDGRQSFDSTTAEVRLSGRAMDRLDWTLGLFHLDAEFRNGQQVSIPAFVPGAFLVNVLNITEAENNSVFAHGIFDLTDRMSVTAGLRYSEDTKDEDFDNNIVQAINTAENHSTDWKLGLDYRVSDDVLVYGSAATGYKPEAFNPRPFQVTQFVPVEGEENISYDLGVKGDFFDRRLRLNIAGFYIDYKQRILPIGGTECLVIPGTSEYNLAPPGTQLGDIDPITGNPAVQDSLGNICFAVTSRTFYDNIPAEVSGVELEFLLRPTEAFTVSGIYGFTDFNGDEFDDPSLLGNPAITEIISDRPIYVPEQNWNVSASYTIPMANGATLTPRVDVYGQSEICPSITTNVSNPTITDNQRCTASYELVNLRLEWMSPEQTWSIAVGGSNVTDEEYFLNKFDLSTFGQPTIEGQPGRPAEWYASFSRYFQ